MGFFWGFFLLYFFFFFLFFIFFFLFLVFGVFFFLCFEVTVKLRPPGGVQFRATQACRRG